MRYVFGQRHTAKAIQGNGDFIIISFEKLAFIYF